jgi:hypothetical protein
VTVAAHDGRRPLVVVGLIEPSGLGGIDRIGFSSLATVQDLAGRPGAVTQVAMALADGQAPGDWIKAHETDLPDGIDLTDAGDALRFYRLQLNALIFLKGEMSLSLF